eukprot:gb/GECG01012402.1/.p1 GENE.gb/GECG01012402.1/~~gb/GECG01012402.1/.p1  ORF type:complete len:821 (+),score=145.14 gb/GECG01012402.1/:1-2463(+)
MQNQTSGTHTHGSSAEQAPDNEAPAWEQSKENVQPRARGRDPNKLNKTLMERNNREDREKQLQAKERDFEQKLRRIPEEDADPLKHWLAYIRWAEQNLPTDGPDDKLFELYERCAQEFEDDSRYKNSLSYLRIWILYADKHSDPADVFKYLYSKKIGENLALFYMAWASVAEQRGNYAFADKIYKQGIGRGAKPKERLQKKQQHFMRRMTKLWIKHTNGEDLFSRNDSSIPREESARQAAETAMDLDTLTDAARKNARLPETRRQNDLETSFARNSSRERKRKPLKSLDESRAEIDREEEQSAENGSTEALVGSADAASSSIPVYVDDESSANSRSGLGEPVQGSWSTLGTLHERTKENTQQRSRWDTASLPSNAPPQATAQPAQLSFSIFEDNGADLNETLPAQDTNLSALDGRGSSKHSEYKKTKKASKQSTAVPAYDASLLSGKMCQQTGLHGAAAAGLVNQRACDIVNGEESDHSDSYPLCFEEVRMLYYLQKNPDALSRVGSRAGEVGGNVSGEQAEDDVGCTNIEQADSEDVTINTKLAMEDLSDLFASPNAKFATRPAANNNNDQYGKGAQGQSMQQQGRKPMGQRPPIYEGREDDTATTGGIQSLVATLEQEDTAMTNASQCVSDLIYNDQNDRSAAAVATTSSAGNHQDYANRPTPRLSPIAAETNNTLVSTALNNHRLFSDSQQRGARPPPAASVNISQHGSGEAAQATANSNPARQLSFAIYEENNEDDKENSGAADENAPPKGSAAEGRHEKTPQRHPSELERNAILRDITPEGDKHADLTGGYTTGEDETDDPGRFVYISQNSNEEN